MEVYLVGGAVRDTLLHCPVAERDWVVVGALPETLLQQGYVQVGKDFPVFLHPQTKEEYALARTERKRGHGHTGFAIDCDPSVSLIDDLKRRDLTINAIAQDQNGTLIDPYNGQQDLHRRILRHVSEAFVEDPLRVLRTARFAARFAHLQFTVAPETLNLMTDIVAQGELAQLPPERVWIELEKALGTRNPQIFVQVLRSCGALQQLLPELEALFDVPAESSAQHFATDSGALVLLALKQAVVLSEDSAVRFAVLLQDLDQDASAVSESPQHTASNAPGDARVMQVCARLRPPKRYCALARNVCLYRNDCHRALELSGDAVLALLNNTDALRRPDRFENFLVACEADARARHMLQGPNYPPADYLRNALTTAKNINAAQLGTSKLKGKALGQAIAEKRIKALELLRRR